MTDARRPAHLAVLVGASAGIYAASLAGITALQSATDQATIENRRPLGVAADALSGGHNILEADLTRAARAYGDAASRYDAVAARLAELETSLDSLAGSVTQVTGAAKSLPNRVSLPPVTRSVVTTRSAPVTHATTGASGG